MNGIQGPTYTDGKEAGLALAIGTAGATSSSLLTHPPEVSLNIHTCTVTGEEASSIVC